MQSLNRIFPLEFESNIIEATQHMFFGRSRVSGVLSNLGMNTNLKVLENKSLGGSRVVLGARVDTVLGTKCHKVLHMHVRYHHVDI